MSKAEKFFHKQIELNDQLLESHKYLSIIFYVTGNYKPSIKSIEKAVAMDVNCSQNKLVEAMLRGKIQGVESESPSVSNFNPTLNYYLRFPIILKSPVEEGLIETLYELKCLNIGKRNLPAKGNVKTSDIFF